MTYDKLISNLRDSINFSFSRFGDGEFFAILGGGGKCNTDQHQYFKDMGMRLYKIIESKPKYIMGLQGKAVRERVDQPFTELIKGLEWVNSDIIHHRFIKTNSLSDMFDALRGRNVILVGNVNLVEVSFKFIDRTTSFKHIVISDKDCWLEYSDVLKRIIANFSKDVVILYCASMMSEVLIDDIYNLYGDDVTQIDIGSAFDPYCGVKSRSYHHKLNLR